MGRNYRKIDIRLMRNIIKRAMNISEAEKYVWSKLPMLQETFTLAEICAAYDDPENRYDKAAIEAQNGLENLLQILSRENVCHVWALMSLGRNWQSDGMLSVPIKRRLDGYLKETYDFETEEMAEHIAGKSPMLAAYLTYGLRLLDL